jgi:hypothetical protein
MNIIMRYLNSGIEGYTNKDLRDILEGKSSVQVQWCSNGTIMLNNLRMIKCVKEYYVKEGMIKSNKKMSNECFQVQKSLNVSSVTNYNCSTCHIHCISRREAGELIKK